jgi:hypothetical protein
LPDIGFVELKVFDMQGREIATFAADYRDKRRYEVELIPDRLVSGFHFYKLNAS